MKTIKKKIPKNIQQMEDLDLQKAIATMITNPNETWKRIRGENIWYLDHTSKTIETKSKCIGPNRYSLNSPVRPQ
jgi:hypothetical protein